MEYKIREKLFGANKASAVGTSLTLNDTVKYPINKLTIDGVCKQETTTGKNLLDYVSNLIAAGGLTSVINEDGSITTTGKPTNNYSTVIRNIDITSMLEDEQTYTISQSTANNKIYVQMIIAKDDGTYTYRNSIQGSSSFTVNKTIYKKYYITIQSNTISSWGDSSLTITNKYMLCKGTDTADTSFEPYTGGQPSPSPEFPQEIKTITDSLKITSCNKNIFNFNETKNLKKYECNYKYENDILELTQTSQWAYVSCDIKVKPNTTYVYSFEMDFEGINRPSNWWLSLYDTKGTTYNKNLVSFINNKIYKIFNTTNSNTLQILFTGSTTTIPTKTIFKNIQLEENPSLTDFEQNLLSKIEAKLPEGEFIGKINDTYKDTLNVVYKEDGKYHLILNKMVGKVVLNGSEEYTNSGLSSNNYIHMMKTIINNIKSAANDDEFVPVMSNYFSNGFSYRSLGYSIAGTNGITIAQNNTLTICHPNYTKENTEGFKNWLSTHNTEVYYPLATPYEVDLGIVDTLLSYDEITNIFTDSDLYPVINVKYYKGLLDISNYEFSIKEV